MTDLTEHLGELMGQSAEEKAADEIWIEAAEIAIGASEGGAPLATSAASDLETGTAGVSTVPGYQPALPDLPSTETAAATTAANGFPFEASELIGLLPHSVAGRAGEIWHFAAKLSAQSDTFLVALIGLAAGFVVIAMASTLRVWRREEEFAVSGFGDSLTVPGSRYAVRQDISLSAEPRPVAKRILDRDDGPLGGTAPSAAQQLQTAVDGGTGAQVSGPRRLKRQLKPKQPNDGDQERVHGWRGVWRADRASRPLRRSQFKDPAAEQTGRPKTTKRETAMAAGSSSVPTSTAPLAASFHGSFGSFHEKDRGFAHDYLKQTIEAFEAGYLSGKGLRLSGRLKAGDNTRAERLFMMATQASGENRQSALTALWQAVEENQEDGIAWLRLANYYMESGDAENAKKILEPILTKAEADGVPLVAASAANALGRIAFQAEDVDNARELFRRGQEHAKRARKPYLFAVITSNLGVLEAASGNHELARDLLVRGIKNFDQCREAIASARTKVVLGAVLKALGDEAEANRVWGEAHATFESEGLREESDIVARWRAGDDPPAGVSL